MHPVQNPISVILAFNFLLIRHSLTLVPDYVDPKPEDFEDVFQFINDFEKLKEVDEGVKISLFNRKLNKYNEEWVQMLRDESGRVPLGVWNFDGDIKVLIHGLTMLPFVGLEGQYYMDMAREYAKYNSSLNIIMVDWSCCSDGPIYPDPVKNTRRVGYLVARFLIALKNVNAFHSWDQVHFVGFSMGAHTSGIAGHFIQQFSGGRDKVGRITGLDPAGPLFDMEGGLLPRRLEGFLDKSDAKFVDVIHCNMGLAEHWSTAPIDGYLGSVVQAGHADFYPNGGSEQTMYCTDAMEHYGCSHLACNKLYIDSLHNPQVASSCAAWKDFIAGKCQNAPKVYMGHHCAPTASGKYYLSVSTNIGRVGLLHGLFKP